MGEFVLRIHSFAIGLQLKACAMHAGKPKFEERILFYCNIHLTEHSFRHRSDFKHPRPTPMSCNSEPAIRTYNPTRWHKIRSPTRTRISYNNHDQWKHLIMITLQNARSNPHLLCFTLLCFTKPGKKLRQNTTGESLFCGSPAGFIFCVLSHTWCASPCWLHNLLFFLQRMKSRDQRLVDFSWQESTCGHYVD